MAKTVTHTRVLDEDEIKELIVEGMKRRGWIVKAVTISTKPIYRNGDLECYKHTASLDIAMPEVFPPTQEQWNGDK